MAVSLLWEFSKDLRFVQTFKVIILCHTYEWGAKASGGGKGFASLMSMFSKKNYISLSHERK